MKFFKAIKEFFFSEEPPKYIVEDKVVLPLVESKPKVKKTTKPSTQKPRAKRPAQKKKKVTNVSEE